MSGALASTRLRPARRGPVQALGAVPDDPVARLAWEEQAAKLGAYREVYGYDAQDSVIGPEPGKTSPEARADWHAAFVVLGRIEGIDLRGCTDAQLLVRRATYERETNWAPPHVGEELRLARLQARAAWKIGARADHEAQAAAGTETAYRHETLAAMWHAMHAKAAYADSLAKVQDTRREWDALTQPTRRAALAAEFGLRRRHPAVPIEPLKSGEPMGILQSAFDPIGPARETCAQETLDGAQHLPHSCQVGAY